MSFKKGFQWVYLNIYSSYVSTYEFVVQLFVFCLMHFKSQHFAKANV